MTIVGWGFAIVIGLPCALFVIVRIAGEMRADARRARKSAATRRTEIVDGKTYSVITEKLPVVREKRTGRTGIVLARGAESDPTMIKGEIRFEPRWIRVQFVRKSDGKASAVQWRQSSKFEFIGTADIDMLTRRSGWFSSEHLMRLPPRLV
jgi:hypothetical protein